MTTLASRRRRVSPPATFPAETSRTSPTTTGGTPYTDAYFTEPTGGDLVRVLWPTSAAPAPGNPPVRFAYTLHGYTGSPNHVNSAFMVATRNGLLDRGFVVVSPNTGGNSWGSPAGLAKLSATHAFLSRYWLPSRVLLHGTSMGALVAANAARHRAIPNVAGLVTIDGVLSLPYAWSTWASSVNAAYAPLSLAQAQAAGYDPCTVTPPVDLPVFAAASPDDTVAVKASNTDVWTARLAPATTTTVATAGAHVETDNFVPTQVLGWLDATFA